VRWKAGKERNCNFLKTVPCKFQTEDYGSPKFQFLSQNFRKMESFSSKFCIWDKNFPTRKIFFNGPKLRRGGYCLSSAMMSLQIFYAVKIFCHIHKPLQCLTGDKPNYIQLEVFINYLMTHLASLLHDLWSPLLLMSPVVPRISPQVAYSTITSICHLTLDCRLWQILC